MKKNEIEDSNEVNSSRATEIVAILFVTAVIVFLFVKIYFY
jgi:hypothetical protein